MSHSADFAYAPMYAIVADFGLTLIPESVKESLGSFIGEHIFTASTFTPAYDYVPRNITTWLAPNISIGAESFDENVVGGPSINPQQFNPAVIQWNNNGIEIGFISVCRFTCPLTDNSS